MHPNEPSLEELKQLYREFLSAASTNENMRKLMALEVQIARREREARENEPRFG